MSVLGATLYLLAGVPPADERSTGATVH